MRKRNDSRAFVLLTAFLLLTAFTLLFHFTSYFSNEGFNPTDEGVVVAQSYRMLHGEVPHKDFISIRPVLSGLIHMLHFYSPLPLIISGRWFAALEYFVYSFLWAWLLLSVFVPATYGSRKKYLILAAAAYWAFLLNMNTCNLFPWTTIDALVFSTAAILFLHRFHLKTERGFFAAGDAITALMLASAASLCRQNFVFIFLLAAFFIAYRYLKFRKFLLLIAVLAAGAVLYIFYLLFLIYQQALPEFISQMRGRSELFETGVLRFAKSFLKTWLLPLHLIVLIYSLAGRFKKSRLWLSQLLFCKKNSNILVKNFIFWYAAALPACLLMFFLVKDYRSVPFEIFWILILLTVLTWNSTAANKQRRLPLLACIALAWVSSISIGDNQPVFVTGNMLITAAFILYALPSGFRPALKLFTWPVSGYVMLGTVILFLPLNIISQRNFNYRDVPSSYLNTDGGDLFSGFGGVKLNPRIYFYYQELSDIIKKHPDLRDKTVVIPNNPVFYALSGSRNPFPLDWMQANEYVGCREQLVHAISTVIEHQQIMVIADRYESKLLAWGYSKANYNVPLYDYMPLLLSEMQLADSTVNFLIYTNPR